MSTTVLEALQGAQHNLGTVGKMGAKNNPIFNIAMEQLNNAIEAIENGMKPDDVIQENLVSEVVTGG